MLIKKLTPVTKNGDRGKKTKIKIQCAQRQNTYPPLGTPSTFVEEWVEVGLLGLLKRLCPEPVEAEPDAHADLMSDAEVEGVRMTVVQWVST